MINVTSPVTGAAITGLTTPTYSFTADTPPNAWSKQWACTSIGGTQTGVDTGTSAAKPWTVTAYRPQNIRILPSVDGNNILRSVPLNEYGVLQRRGLTPLSGQPPKIGLFRFTAAIPAGAELADLANLRAANSCMFGVLAQQAQGMTDTEVTGVL